jgi:hypothetical protein
MIKTVLKTAVCLVFLSGATSAQEPLQGGDAMNNPWAEGGYQPIPLPEVEGTLPWETLSQVELVFEGPDLVPEYGDEVQNLSGERIKMVGFMLPLDAAGERILLSQYAPHCPFCMTAGPESFVELQCDDRIEMSLEPIVVEGTFEVLEQSWEGYYYRMADAKVIEP